MKETLKILPDNLYDAAIIGGGPAGLTAAIYLARAKYRVLVLEKDQLGGQITITDEVVNYPGIEHTSGKALTDTMRRQAENFGAEFHFAEVTSIDTAGDIKKVKTRDKDFHCFGILIATGAHPRNVGFEGEEEFKGRGVAYCATCDGEFFTGKEIFVIGGGFAAAEESIFLTKFARHVTIIMRGEDFSCAASVSNQVKKNDKIDILTNTIVEKVSGQMGLNYIRYKDTKTGKITEYRAEPNDSFGLFVFAGYSPETSLVHNLLDLNPQGYIITDSKQMTNVKGIYAAGDVCIKSLRQVVTATGDGAIAATELEKYAATMQRKTGLHPKIHSTENKLQSITQDDFEKGLKHESEDRFFNESSNYDMPSDTEDIFNKDTRTKLNEVFNKMEHKIILKLSLDESPLSLELKDFITKLADLTDKLVVAYSQINDSEKLLPNVKIFKEDGTYSGIGFYGVPTGHEFTSFVLGVYNASGSGQQIDGELLRKIQSIDKKINMKILVSLSCTMCPDLVTACQRIATLNPNITAEVYDIHHFEILKKKYNVMSVPCLVINDTAATFGKKSISQVVELLTNH